MTVVNIKLKTNTETNSNEYKLILGDLSINEHLTISQIKHTSHTMWRDTNIES